MNELKLTRAIILDNDEILHAGSTIPNYGNFTPKSIAPSLIESGKVKILKGKCKEAFDVAGKENIINFCRIQRECIDETLLSGLLRKSFVKGDSQVSPFFCSVKAESSYTKCNIEEITDNDKSILGSLPPLYDCKLEQICCIAISTFGELRFGRLSMFSELIDIKNSHLDPFDIVIAYYYSNTSAVKVDSISRKKFYVDLRAYHSEIYFEELKVMSAVSCYEEEDGKARFCQDLRIIETGDNQWLSRFFETHSYMMEADYIPRDGDIHILAQYYYYDGEKKKNVEGLTLLHRSTNRFIFTQQRRKPLKVLIKEDNRR